MFDRFDDNARKILNLATKEARSIGHDYIGSEHILLGLIKAGDVKFESPENDIYTLVRSLVGADTTDIAFSKHTEIPYTPRAKNILNYAISESERFGHRFVGPEHIILGIINDSDGRASEILHIIGIDIDELEGVILGSMSTESGMSNRKENSKDKSGTKALEQFGRDLTQLAKDGELDPVIGRTSEIERMMQILIRRTKSNPVLIGESGVGKTAIVEGLAQAIINKKVPKHLIDKRIFILDLALMVAGTKFRGQFEERLKDVMEEVKNAGNVILFLDELHTIIGAGGSEGAMDASNIMKPALSRSDLQCIGATTLDEYRKYIEKDTALVRRFQTIKVEQPTKTETLQILLGLKDRYEDHHNVIYTDESLLEVVNLAERYITDRFFPDKAIDIIDEAGSRMNLLNYKNQLETDDNSEESIDDIEKQKDEAIREQDFEKAAALRDQIKTFQKTIAKEDRVIVDETIIQEVITSMTGIPLVKAGKEESIKLIGMEKHLQETVIGQDEAVKTLSKCLRRSKAGLKDPKKPIGTFLFVGPTGVGKTHLSKALSKFMFDNDDALIHIDMSEYMEKHSVSRLVGAPPGYVGYEEGGQLTEKVRRNPYSVILLDEIEKAHEDVYNILLQIMEEGKLTDSFGRVVDFKNTVIILTSNVGVGEMKNSGNIGFTKTSARSREEVKTSLMGEIEKEFKPEFINRLDDLVFFKSLDKEDISEIIHLELRGVFERLGNHNINVDLSDEAIEFLVEKGFDSEYGARPLKRAIEKYVSDALSEGIISGEFEDDSNLKGVYNTDSDSIDFIKNETVNV